MHGSYQGTEVPVNLPVSLDSTRLVAVLQQLQGVGIPGNPRMPRFALRRKREQSNCPGHRDVEVGLQLLVAAGENDDAAEICASASSRRDVAFSEVLNQLVEPQPRRISDVDPDATKLAHEHRICRCFR